MDQPLEHSSTPGGPKVELQGKEVKVQQETPPAPTAEELIKEVDEIGERLRALIVASKRAPRQKGLDAHQDPVRSLSLAQAHLQTGFMWLRRSIEQPKSF